MQVAGKIFGNICLKAIRDAFFSNMWSVISEEQGDLIFWWGDIQQKGKAQTFGLAERPHPSFLP